MFATSLGLGGKERFFRFENAFKGNLEVYFCVHQKLEPGCITAHSQQSSDSGEFRSPCELSERSLRNVRFLLIKNVAFSTPVLL